MQLINLYLEEIYPITLNHPTPDHECLKKADEMPKIDYPKADGVYSFDRIIICISFQY